MSNQLQPTAEKSVQTQDSSGLTTLSLPNNPENTATEVANTLVSMATGRQQGVTTIKPLNVISLPNQSPASLPILSLADYTTANGVPTAAALANQAMFHSKKPENTLDDNNDDISMSTDQCTEIIDDSNTVTKARRGKSSKSTSTMRNRKQEVIQPIQYGPILVKPRKSIAPTLANGRKSKDDVLPPEEDNKRKQRRDRNRQAAAKCRKKRNELRDQLEKLEKQLVEQERNLCRSVQSLSERKHHLEDILVNHACSKSTHLPLTNVAPNNINISRAEIKQIPTTTLFDANNSKRVTINLNSAQDLFAVSPLTRISTGTDAPSSSASGTSVPMITIHILPEVAQALLGSTTVDRAKLVDLLQQTNSAASFVTTSNNHVKSESISTNASINRTS